MSSHDMRKIFKGIANRERKWRKRRKAIADRRHGRNRPASIWWPLFALLALLGWRRA